MFSRCLSFVLVLGSLCGIATAASAPLRICADPDDPPFSLRSEKGFDNRIAIVIAHDLGREPLFIWTRSRRGFTREQFNKNACDVLTGVPAGMKSVATTRPYYRSTYVFVTRVRDHLRISSFSDPQLNGRRIGLQILEEDMAPPSLPLIRTGHAGQLVGFESFGTQGGDIVRAVSDGRIGLAVVWGPLAGYFAARQPTPLRLTPVTPAVDASGVPFTFALTFGVHRNDVALRNALNASIERMQPRIRQLLADYYVPILPLSEGAQ